MESGIKREAQRLQGRLFVATMAGDWRQVAAEYELGVELDHFCSAENMDPPAFDGAETAVRAALSQAGDRRPPILHAPFNELHPAAIDPRALALARQRYEQAFGLARRYGAKRMVVHSGYVPQVYFKEWHLARSVLFWTDYIRDKPVDFTLLIENVLEDEPYMLRELLEGIGEKLRQTGTDKHLRSIRLCLDLGHANCMGAVPASEWIRVLAPLIGHVHIHNNYGDWDHHQSADDGTVDMEEAIGLLLGLCDADTTFTIESREAARTAAWLTERGFL